MRPFVHPVESCALYVPHRSVPNRCADYSVQLITLNAQSATCNAQWGTSHRYETLNFVSGALFYAHCTLTCSKHQASG